MKQETPEQRAIRKGKEQKKLTLLEKAQAKQSGQRYFIILFFVLAIIYIADELASNMNGTMQPYVILDLFKIPNGNILSPEYAQATAKFALLSIPTMAFMFLAPFYKSLADRFGRRPFLVINTLVMGIGLLVCMIAPNFWVYFAGVLLVAFVQSNDMQVMYIMETAPAKHRAKLCTITKSIALVGVSLIGVSRTIFYDPNTLSSWRFVFLIPAVVAIIVAFISIPLVQETPVFIKGRIDYLKMADDERIAQAGKDVVQHSEQVSKKQSGGILKAIRYISKNKQLRSVTWAIIAFCLATSIPGFYTTILEASSQLGKITSEQISVIIVFFPFINGIMTFFAGFISDALGRKRGILVLLGIAILGLTGFILSMRAGLNPYIIGTCYGLFIGGFWTVSDTMVLIIPSESAPTELRASIIGTLSLILSIGSVISYFVVIAGMNIVGAANIGLFCFCFAVPLLLLSMFLLFKNVQETAGIDLSKIGQATGE